MNHNKSQEFSNLIELTNKELINECKNFKHETTILKDPGRVIAIGDIHGDYNLAVSSFKLANLISGNNFNTFKWIAEPSNTIVIQIGDQIDSCRTTLQDGCLSESKNFVLNEDMKVIDFFNLMNKLASEKGGKVISLLGNHELMNSQGYMDYVSYKNKEKFHYSINGVTYDGINGRKLAFKPGGEIAKMIACTRKLVVVVGNNIFVHGGILPGFIKKLDNIDISMDEKLEYINMIVRKWLLNKIENKSELDLMDSVLGNKEDLITDSPLWSRVFGNIKKDSTMSDKECSNVINELMKIYQFGSIIVAHTPQLTGINGTCLDKNNRNKIYRIDGAFSKSFHNKTKRFEILEIKNGNKFIIHEGKMK